MNGLAPIIYFAGPGLALGAGILILFSVTDKPARSLKDKIVFLVLSSVAYIVVIMASTLLAFPIFGPVFTIFVGLIAVFGQWVGILYPPVLLGIVGFIGTFMLVFAVKKYLKSEFNKKEILMTGTIVAVFIGAYLGNFVAKDPLGFLSESENFSFLNNAVIFLVWQPVILIAIARTTKNITGQSALN